MARADRMISTCERKSRLYRILFPAPLAEVVHRGWPGCASCGPRVSAGGLARRILPTITRRGGERCNARPDREHPRRRVPRAVVGRSMTSVRFSLSRARGRSGRPAGLAADNSWTAGARLSSLGHGPVSDRRRHHGHRAGHSTSGQAIGGVRTAASCLRSSNEVAYSLRRWDPARSWFVETTNSIAHQACAMPIRWSNALGELRRGRPRAKTDPALVSDPRGRRFGPFHVENSAPTRSRNPPGKR